MGKSSQKKIDYAKSLLKEGIPYLTIQERLKANFGNGMSNTTLNKIKNHIFSSKVKDDKIQELERELALFKKLYFELLDKVKEKLEK